MGGYLYLPACDCSECGHTVNIEKPICPYCGTIMDRTAPADQEGPIEGEPETDKKD
jgi:rRNA maturation endonuclease Nob1